MFLINTSFHVDKALYDEAVDLVKSKYVPMLESSGVFFEPLTVSILSEIDPDCRSFAIQAKADSLDAAGEWLDGPGALFFGSLRKQYGDRCLFFTTPMEIIG